MRGSHRALCALLVVAGLSAQCSRPDYTQHIQRYQQAHREATPVLVDLYARLNAFERESYVATSACSGAQLVPTVRMEGAGPVPTPLFHETFSAEAIQARVDALEALGLYAEYLGALAGSDAPRRFTAASEQLATRVGNIERHFRPGLPKYPNGQPPARSGSGGDATSGGEGGGGGLTSQTAQGVSGPGQDEPATTDTGASTNNASTSTNEGASASAGPNTGAIFGALFNLISQEILEEERDERLRDGILRGRDFVRVVLDVLEDDFTHVVNQTREDWYTQQLTACASYYNDHRDGWTLDQRQALGERLVEIANRREAFRLSNPVELVRAMRDAHGSLVSYAQNPDANRSTISRLASAMEQFARRVGSAVDTYRRLESGEGLTSDVPSGTSESSGGDRPASTSEARTGGSSSSTTTTTTTGSRPSSTSTTTTSRPATSTTTTTRPATTSTTTTTRPTTTTTTTRPTTPATRTTTGGADAGVPSRPGTRPGPAAN